MSQIKYTKGELCAIPTRPGIDLEAIEFLANVETAFYAMRDASETFMVSSDRDRAAVQQWLTYLGILIDMAASAAVAVATHGMPFVMFTIRRSIVEYVVKALYYDKYPHRAHYDLTLGQRRDILIRTRDEGGSPQEIADAEAEVVKAEREFPEHVNEKLARFGSMMQDVTDRATYSMVYRGLSVLTHADALGMGDVMPVIDGKVVGNIDVTNERLNANLIDIGSDMMLFCDVFLRNYPESRTPEIENRFAELKVRYERLALRHSHGRSPDVISELEQQHGSSGA